MRHTLLICFVLQLSLAAHCQSPPDVGETLAIAPRTIDQLKNIQFALQQRIAAARDSVVAIHVSGGIGSGVIISSDGYVLTARHVVGPVGSEVRFTFHDGTSAYGKVVSAIDDVDAALLKFTVDVPESSRVWRPILIATPDDRPKIGAWCFALGHSGGFDPSRPIPVRLGKVIKGNRLMIRTDCVIAQGDSGGPLLDMSGKLIGVHTRVGQSQQYNTHLPIFSIADLIDEAKRGGHFSAAPASLFLSHFDINDDDVIDPAELGDKPEAELYYRIADRFRINPRIPHSINHLRRIIGFDISTSRRRLPLDAMMTSVMPSTWGEPLDASGFARGRSIREIMREVSGEHHASVVKISKGRDTVGYGTIVSSDGWMVCKWDSLKKRGPIEELRFLWNDDEIQVAHIAISQSLDLAWFRIKSDIAFVPIQFERAGQPQVGTWIYTLASGPVPVASGVVSVATRPIPPPPGYIGITGEDAPGGARVHMLAVGSGAEGKLFTGDVIKQVGDHPIGDFAELIRHMRRFQPGDEAELTVRRDGFIIDVTVKLVEHPRITRVQQDEVTGTLSARRDGFPWAFQHDSILEHWQCGSPVFDLDGQFQGVNIAKASRVSTLAIPGDVIRDELARVIEDYQKSGLSEE